ncbi:hypothetical protein H5410_022498 [Solanum commersonii]|uniref:Uncharacterized protein n=1 Tax=Solanum commersonii TaxID=4109 RepID=A0A9J5ZEB2_SOLCO|nr:hypothetical protein H5410_022498 [Solanum commersonii]
MEALVHFSATIGLVANMEKSNRMNEQVKQQLLEITEITQGSFPIRYLRLPLTFRRWGKLECHKLIDKITNRIKKMPIQNNSLMQIHNFWASMFILPQSVVKEVDRICRDYLWGGTEEKRKVPLISWEKVCLLKRHSGLYIKGCGNWNVAYVGKFIWQLAVNKKSLWFNLTTNGDYSITSNYTEQTGNQAKLEVAELVWNSVLLPRQRFIMWSSMIAYKGETVEYEHTSRKQYMLHVSRLIQFIWSLFY